MIFEKWWFKWVLCTIFSAVVAWSVAWQYRHGHWILLSFILFPIFVGLISILECAKSVRLLERGADGTARLKCSRRSLWAETFKREFELSEKSVLVVGPAPGDNSGSVRALMLKPDEKGELLVLVVSHREEPIRDAGERAQRFLNDPKVSRLDLSCRESQAAHIAVLGCGLVLLYVWLQAMSP